ncbi:MAG TPA: DUF5606 domain-containing protein [Bacteroidales bacterium]|nr:DUF5606 domain-containing protein [Bacteroidales bacterium]
MMDLTKILAISGKPGLFLNIGQTKGGLIVESLTEGKRFPVFAHEKMNSLAEISVFTVDEDVTLLDVFKRIGEKYGNKPAINSGLSGDQLKNFMKEILPNYDPDRVYTSDIKKILGWYNLLAEKEMLDFTEEVNLADEPANTKPEKSIDEETKADSPEIS